MTIPLFKPTLNVEAILQRVRAVLESGYIAEGAVVQEFEAALEQVLTTPVLTVNSGTSAIWLALDCAGVGQGDTIISTPMTCMATNLPALHRGARILWADCNPRTGNICPDSVWKLLAKYRGVKAIVCVDYAGVPCDLAALRGIAQSYNAVLIEDAAHSFGATYRGRPIGTLADITCFSFQAIKHLTTGDGGALAFTDSRLVERARLLRWFGLDRIKGGFRCDQEVTLMGYKFHMNDLTAAVGLANLPLALANIARAKENGLYYQAALLDAGLAEHGPSTLPNVAPAWWFFPLRVPERESFIARMAAAGVECARPHARNDLQPVFKGHAYGRDLKGVAEFDRTHVGIPVGGHVLRSDREHVARTMVAALKEMHDEHA